MHDLLECRREIESALWCLTNTGPREGHAHAIQSVRRAYWHIRKYTCQPDDGQPFGPLGSKRLTHQDWEAKRWSSWDLLQQALEALERIPQLCPGSCNQLAWLLYRAYEAL